MKSFALLRTNVGLTTNIKIMVDSQYNLSLDSIDSKEELSNTKFKKRQFIKQNYWDELITWFYNGLPADTAYHIKFEEDVDTMGNDFSLQYDELYQYGARNIINNKNYIEEFEYFAPLYISPGKLPKYFIIFRVDGPGIITLNQSNFKSEIVKKLKTVKIFDLTETTDFGDWLSTNFNNNKFFPLSPLEVSFDNLEFTKWNGIDYDNGGYVSKSTFLETYYEEEREIFEFEKYFFDGFRNNRVVMPNILNISFLFDDIPATEEYLRKWSLNRYFGYYLDDLVAVKTISPYITPFIKSGSTILQGNYLFHESGDPFVEGYFPNRFYYLEYLGNYYKVEKVQETGKKKFQPKKTGNIVTQSLAVEVFTKYKIIADVNLTGKQDLVNKNIGKITTGKKLINYDNTDFVIEDWDKADVWLIEIDGVYHNLIKDTDGSIKVYSDYFFEFRENDYSYGINSSDSNFTKKVSFIVDADNQPKKLTIYKLNFTDIKDFDDRIVDTEYSKYEYEKRTELTNTDETKMYLVNLRSSTFPKDLDDFVYKSKVVNIPVSSEYTANYETFKVERNELSEIWRKNPVSCRWVFQNSLSANDYPYSLNNSLIFEDYNRTVNPFEIDPKRIERNLDYFYSLNSSTHSYLHHTLHVEDFNSDKTLNTNFEFELDKYLNLGTYSSGTYSLTYNFDYFTYFFERKAHFDYGKVSKNVKKYSLFNSGDNSIPNITLFRGLKFYIYDIENVNPSAIKKDETGKLDVINLKSSNSFDGYKFSILLTDNEFSVTSAGGLTSSVNTMTWEIFDDWQMDKEYDLNSLVVMDSIVYRSTSTANNTTNPVKLYLNADKVKSAPYNQSPWIPHTLPFNNSLIFYSPVNTYPNDAVDYSATSPGIVYNNKDYYYYNGGVDDIWNPMISDTVGYNQYVTVLFAGQYYMSTTQSNRYRPDYQIPYRVSEDYQYYWVATQSADPTWLPIQLWNPSYNYPQITGATYVVHDDIVWKTKSSNNIPWGSETGNQPGISSDWERVYSLKPDTNVVYKANYNPIIEINEKYYLCTSNTTNSTLEAGINIYINKKWKNILININISDNTTVGISNTDRDELYNELNRKLTAFNFMRCINDLSIKYSFTDYVNYIIIEENGSISKYNYDNIEGLPNIIFCEGPTEIVMKANSLSWNPIELPNELKPSKFIKFIQNDLSNINDYNNLPVAAEITPNRERTAPPKGYHGSKVYLEDSIYRHSGFYMPLFCDIELFEKNFFTSSVGNYVFDTSLTEFGLVRERKIRKINKLGSVLKLKDAKNLKSIYPMVDEFGYTFVDFFIFKSTFDNEYHYSTVLNNQVISAKPPKSLGNSISVGQQVISQNINNL